MDPGESARVIQFALKLRFYGECAFLAYFAPWRETGILLCQIRPELAKALRKYFLSPSRKDAKGKPRIVETGVARLIQFALKLLF